jgi:hypothetical protein
LTLDRVTVSDGNVNGIDGLVDGGGIDNAGTLAVTRSTVSGNEAFIAGGGIYNGGGGVVTVTSSTLTGNTAGGEGGGIENDTGGVVAVIRSTVAGNAAGNTGGGMLNSDGGVVTVTDTTVASNSGRQGGGGLMNEGTMTVTSSTIADNTSSGGYTDAGVDSEPQFAAATTVKATIVANNTGFDPFSFCNGALGCAIPDANCYGRVVDEGNNLSDGATCGFTSAEHSLSNTPAGLDPAGLGNNGGPTQTIALLPSSPAVDYVPRTSLVDPSGAQLKTDQRGLPRPDRHETFGDIGAYEHQD